MLIALLIPAVQKVRAAAARLRCSNNLKQLGLAAHQFSDATGRFPAAVLQNYSFGPTGPGGWNTNADFNFGPNWAVQLLPYLEQDALFRSVESSVRSYPKTGDPGWRLVRGTSVAVLRCPADADPAAPYLGEGGNWARGNYAANSGPHWFYESSHGNSSAEWFGNGGGVMCINWGASFTDLTSHDGTGYTILFNEVRTGVSPLDRRGTWAMGFPGASVTAANALGDCPTPNDKNEHSDDIQGCVWFYFDGIGRKQGMGCDWRCDDNASSTNRHWPSLVECGSRQAQARSRHRGGVNSCFADGSVRYVSDEIAQSAWAYLNSRDDGKTVSVP